MLEQDAPDAIAYIPDRGVPLWDAAHIWHWLWQLLLLHPPCVAALQRLRSLPESGRYWSQGMPERDLSESLRPGGPYRVELEAISHELSPTFSQFPWWAWWLHCAAKGGSRIVGPFSGISGSIEIGPLVVAPDRTWEEVRGAFEAFRPEWERQRMRYSIPQKNKPIAQPASAAVWLFWSEFLEWEPPKIADAFEETLSTNPRGLKLQRKWGVECRQEAHRIRGLFPPGLLKWPRDNMVRQDQAVRNYLRKANELLREPRSYDHRPPTE